MAIYYFLQNFRLVDTKTSHLCWIFLSILGAKTSLLCGIFFSIVDTKTSHLCGIFFSIVARKLVMCVVYFYDILEGLSNRRLVFDHEYDFEMV